MFCNPQNPLPASPEIQLDVAGRTFGWLRTEYRRGRDVACRCVCEKLIHVAAEALADGVRTSCGCQPASPEYRTEMRALSDQRRREITFSPACATQALIRAESLPRRIWEPAAGRGAIVRELHRAAGHSVISSDIVERDYPLDFVANFLTAKRMPTGCEAIVTNPPYDRKTLDPFVRHALDICPRVYLLLRLSFLEGTGRSDILESRGLARVHVFRDRLPMMHRDGWAGPKARNATSFAWFTWIRGHDARPEIRRISTKS